MVRTMNDKEVTMTTEEEEWGVKKVKVDSGEGGGLMTTMK